MFIVMSCKEWLHIYTDGSKLVPTGTGAGVFSKLFEISLGVGANASNFDGEVTAVRLAAEALDTLHPAMNRKRVVLLIDSQAAITAIADSSPTDCPSLFRCREAISHLQAKNWEICLQWIPSHVGIAGNERADDLAKKGAQMQQPNFEVSLTSAKHLIDAVTKRSVNERHEEASRGKQWASLSSRGPLPHTTTRATAVAEFRLLTGHDYLQAHLHRFGLAEVNTCPLCLDGVMDGDHINTCPELDDQLSIADRYWEARRRMAQQPRAGIG